MTAFILFALATAEVKGFAFMLGIGMLVSLFTAVLATQAALGAMSRSRLVTHPSALGAARKHKGWTFDFMGASKWFFSMSGTILLVGALAIGGNGINFGIDFKSGTRIQTAFIRHASQSEVAEVMTAQGFPNAEVQKFSNKSIGGDGYQISTKTLRPEKLDAMQRALDAKFGNGPSHPGTKDFSSTSIGPTFGKTVENAAIIAIIASLLVISAYIALRFEWKYAVPVLIALMHDLLITAGVYALTGKEVSTATVAALLTILGYSLYDTIIVFDRIRENVPRMPRAAFSQIVNRSMSEVVTRSLATSFCTLLPVLALLLFGGDTLKDFAFALMIGIASGAYSSIFIASPVLTHWKERESGYRARRAADRARTRRGAGVCDDRGGRARGRRAGAEAQAHAQRWAGGTRGTGAADLARRVPGARSRPGRRGRAQRRRRLRSGRSQERRQRHRGTACAAARRPAARPGGRPHARGPGAQGRAQTREEPTLRRAPQQTSRQVALMGLLAWVIMGLAIWHFTIFLPDRFWGGIVGAFVGSLIGSVVVGLIIFSIKVSSLSVPGKKATDIGVVLYAVPGALIGIALIYLEGMRRERAGRQPDVPAL